MLSNVAAVQSPVALLFLNEFNEIQPIGKTAILIDASRALADCHRQALKD